MISVYKLKPKFQQLLKPILAFFYKRNVTANQITIASIVLSLLIGLLFWCADYCNWFFLVLPIGLHQKGYSHIRFTNFDCFDPKTYQLINFEPNITIISGIFELFGDNQLTNEALKGIVSISEENSHIVYTGQPWHPQLKMIAFVLNSHQKKDWVMRRRSQKELDRIMAFNHIKKEDMLIDDYGIFTVSSGKVKG